MDLRHLALPAALLLLLFLPQATMAQGCGVSISAQTPVVNFPGSGLPSNGTPTFYEPLNVNYSSAYSSQTVTVQYFNGTGWRDLQSFKGNVVGFTEADVGVDSGWAHFGQNQVRAVTGSCHSDPVALQIAQDALAVPEAVAAYALLGVLLGLFFIFGRRLGKTRFILVAAAVYLAVAPFTGQRYDIYFLLSSGIRILQHVNPFNPGTPPLYPGPLKWAHPPLYAVYSGVSFVIYQLITGGSLPSVSALTYPGWLTSTYNVWLAYIPPSLPVLVFLLKLPMVASAILTGVLMTKMTGDSSLLVRWVANPLVVLVAAIWGQVDPIATLMAVASIYTFQRGKQYQAYALASLGAAVKVWPALMIPILFVVSVRKDGRRAMKPLLAVLPALLLTLGLYGAYGNIVESLFVFVYARGVPTYAGQFSVNGLTWQQVLFVLKSPPLPVFLVIGIPAYIAVLGWVYLKKQEDVAKWLTVSILLFYLTYNYVNPQYFYWILPLLMIRGRRWAAAVFTALPLVFVALSYNLFYFVSPTLLPDQFALGASIAEQLKVSFFYGTPAPFLVVAALIPTCVYLAQLLVDLRRRNVQDVPSISTSE